MEKLVEGLWDCPYCNQKGIGGLTKKCPGCGHPQDEGTKFYVGENKSYLSEDQSKEYGQGADWTCSYCETLNRHNSTECAGCGAPREQSSGDYFDNQKRIEEQEKKQQSSLNEIASAQSHTTSFDKTTKNSFGKRKKLGIFFAVIVALFAFFLWPKNTTGIVQDKSWSRNIEVETYKTVKENDWSIPEGGREYDKKEEIHHYDTVIDHYEDVTVTKTRQVQDGYDTHTNYIDNGDGTFREETVSTPRYVTETYTEVETQPVYVDVPVYQTKYYYEIERWVYERSVSTSGKKEEPYWGDVALKDQEREGKREENYIVTFVTKKNKTYEKEMPFDEWKKYEMGEKKKLVIQLGEIKKIK